MLILRNCFEMFLSGHMGGGYRVPLDEYLQFIVWFPLNNFSFVITVIEKESSCASAFLNCLLYMYIYTILKHYEFLSNKTQSEVPGKFIFSIIKWKRMQLIVFWIFWFLGYVSKSKYWSV